MTEDSVVSICRTTLYTALMLAGPMLLAGLLIGLTMSIVQTITSVNEQTMTLIPKILVVAATLSFAFPWVIQTLVSFTKNLYTNMNQIVGY